MCIYIYIYTHTWRYESHHPFVANHEVCGTSVLIQQERSAAGLERLDDRSRLGNKKIILRGPFREKKLSIQAAAGSFSLDASSGCRVNPMGNGNLV